MCEKFYFLLNAWEIILIDYLKLPKLWVSLSASWETEIKFPFCISQTKLYNKNGRIHIFFFVSKLPGLYKKQRVPFRSSVIVTHHSVR